MAIAMRREPTDLVGRQIYKLREITPHKAVTKGYHAWQLPKDGMSYEQYIAAGEQPNHLRWDFKRNHCKLNGPDNEILGEEQDEATIDPCFIQLEQDRQAAVRAYLIAGIYSNHTRATARRTTVMNVRAYNFNIRFHALSDQ